MDRQTAELMEQLAYQIDGLWERLERDQRVDDAERQVRYWEKHTEALRRQLAEQTTHTFSETKNYINTICAVGYAGYFAIWTLAKDSLSKSDASFVALMGLISLAVFCLWEVLNMILYVANVKQTAHHWRNTLTPEDYEEIRAKIAASNALLIARTTPAWIIVLCVTIGCVLLGAGVAASRFYGAISILTDG